MNKTNRAAQWLRTLLPTAVILSILAIWQAAVSALEVPKWLLPSPSSVISAFWEFRGDLVLHTWATLKETLLGLLLGVVLAVPTALLMASSDLINRALSPILVAIYSIPKTAIAPLLLLWMGTGEGPKIVLACLISFFPIVVNTLAGVLNANQDMVDLIRSMKGSKFQIMLKIRLPNALPHMFSAFKVAVSLAIIGTVIGEFVGSDLGLGYMILIASSQLQTDLAFTCIALLAVMGVLMFKGVAFLERKLMPWHISSSDRMPPM